MNALQFTPLIGLYILSSIVMSYLTYRTWTLRPARGAFYWAFTSGFLVLFVMASGLEILFVDLTIKLWMTRLIYVGLVGFIIFYALFSMSYSNHTHWITPRIIAILSIIPIITLILVFFVDQHHLIYREFVVVEAYGLQVLDIIEYGTFFYVWAIFAYGVIFGSAYLLIKTVWQSPNVFQGQASMMLLSVLVSAGSGTIYMFGYNPIAPLDPSPFSLTLTGILMYFSMVRFKFLSVSPVAQNVIFHSVESAIIIVDPSQKIINMNHQAEALLNQELKHLIGAPLADVFVALAIPISAIDELVKDNTVIEVHDQSYELRITPLQTRDGQNDGYILMFYDISERLKMAQQKLDLLLERDRVQFLKQFINDASHDFKTPLSILKTNLYLLRRQYKEMDTERINVMEAQMERLNRLVDDMLFLVRLDDNDIEKEKDSINALMALVINIEKSRDNNIQFIPLQDDITLNMEQLELTRAFTNIVENAINFTDSDDTITIAISTIPQAVQVSIRDTGAGIPPESLPFIFNRFYRVDQSRSMANGGAGLGLAITKRIIERHGGTIDVKSTVDLGSEFIVTLPIEQTMS